MKTYTEVIRALIQLQGDVKLLKRTKGSARLDRALSLLQQAENEIGQVLLEKLEE